MAWQFGKFWRAAKTYPMLTWPRSKCWRTVVCGIIHWRTVVKGNVRGSSSSQYFARTTCTDWCCDVGANARRIGRVSRRFTATSKSWLWIKFLWEKNRSPNHVHHHQQQQQQQRRGPNQLQSAEKHPDCFLDRFCMCGSNFSRTLPITLRIHRDEESSMPKHQGMGCSLATKILLLN